MWGPKTSDRQFLSAFSRHAAVAVRAAGLLVTFLEQPDRADLPLQIETDEHEGDRILHDVVHALRGTWITPFDRTDIQNLISALDDVLDLIHACAKRVLLFDIQTSPPEALALARQILRATQMVHQATELLTDMKRAEEILKLCETLHEIENEGDELYRQVLGKLYKPGNDPLQIMKWREIYENLETALDRCEDVADHLAALVLEYS
jgi:predicted phosphate transport protein (TIGR00153 family)